MASKAMEMQEEDDEMEVGPLLIQELEKCGVNNGDVAKLQGAGFHTVESVAYATMKQLCEIKGISEGKATKLQTESKVRQSASTRLNDRRVVNATIFKSLFIASPRRKLVIGFCVPRKELFQFRLKKVLLF